MIRASRTTCGANWTSWCWSGRVVRSTWTTAGLWRRRCRCRCGGWCAIGSSPPSRSAGTSSQWIRLPPSVRAPLRRGRRSHPVRTFRSATGRNGHRGILRYRRPTIGVDSPCSVTVSTRSARPRPESGSSFSPRTASHSSDSRRCRGICPLDRSNCAAQGKTTWPTPSHHFGNCPIAGRDRECRSPIGRTQRMDVNAMTPNRRTSASRSARSRDCPAQPTGSGRPLRQAMPFRRAIPLHTDAGMHRNSGAPDVQAHRH